MRSSTLLIGIGNILLGDDGIGVHTVREIERRYLFDPEIDIIDGGTKGLDLLPFLEGRGKVLIVDALDSGMPPGHISILRNKEIPTVLQAKLSVHHIGLGEVLLALEMLDKLPEEITLVGIQPARITTGLDISYEVGSRMEDLIKSIIDKLSEWGIKCIKRV